MFRLVYNLRIAVSVGFFGNNWCKLLLNRCKIDHLGKIYEQETLLYQMSVDSYMTIICLNDSIVYHFHLTAEIWTTFTLGLVMTKAQDLYYRNKENFKDICFDIFFPK